MSQADEPAEAVKALLTPAGVELLKRVGDEDVDASNAMRVGERLRREYPPSQVAAAIAQHQLRLHALGFKTLLE